MGTRAESSAARGRDEGDGGGRWHMLIGRRRMECVYIGIPLHVEPLCARSPVLSSLLPSSFLAQLISRCAHALPPALVDVALLLHDEHAPILRGLAKGRYMRGRARTQA